MSEKTRILIVEDLVSDFDLAQFEIRNALGNCVFKRVESRQDYLDALEKFQPDVILSDYNLPHFDGISALKLAKQRSPVTPFLVWTGSLSEDIAVECMRAGANNYIIKENLKRLGPAMVHALEERKVLLEQKRSESIIRDLARFPEENPNPVFRVSKNGQIVFANSASQVIFDAWGTSINGFLPPDLCEIVLRTFEEDVKKSLDISIQRRTYSLLLVPIKEAGYINLYGADVTERKRAEDKYQDIFEQSQEGIFQSTPDGRYLKVNPAMAYIYGYDSPEDMIASVKNIASQIYAVPEDHARFVQMFQQNQMVEKFETRNLRKDGSVIWTSTSARTVRDADGGILYYEGFLHDITERKLAEQKLLESEARYHGIFESAQDAIFLENLEGDIVEVNQQACKMYGYSAEEFRTKKVVDLVPSQEYIIWFDQNQNSPKQVHETINVRANGEHFPVEISGGIYEYGESKFFLIVLRDITERKLAEEKYQDIFEHSEEGIFQSTPQGRFIKVNPAMARIYGYDSPEVMLESITSIADQLYTHPGDRSEFTQLLQSEGHVENFEMINLRKDGSVIWTQTSARVVCDKDGNFLYYEGFLQDITKRKQAEEGLKERERNTRILLDTIAEGVALNEIVYDDNGEMVDYRILQVNQAFYATADFNGQLVIGRLATEVYGMTSDFIKEFWKLHLQKNTTAYTEMVSPLNNRHFFVATSPFVDDTFVTTFFDITERKLAEQKLRESEERFRALIENSLDNISLLKADGTLLWENPAVNRTLGYEQDQFVGRNIFELMHPDDQERTLDLFGKVIREPEIPQHATFRLKHQDDTWRWIEATGTNMLNNPAVHAIVINYRDVTERKQAEVELQDTRELFQKTFHNSPVATVLSRSSDRSIVDTNKAMEDLLGYTRSEMIGQPTMDFDYWVDDEERQWMYTTLLQLGHITNYEFSFRNKEREVGRAILSAEFIEQKDAKYVLTTFINITDRKSAEIEIQKQNDDLQLINAINEAALHSTSLNEIVDMLAREFKRMFSSTGSTLYMLNPDGRTLTIQQYILPPGIQRQLERLIGSTIPLIQIPLREGGFLHNVLKQRRGIITQDREEIQNWIGEFVETPFLPDTAKTVIRSLIPQIYNVLNIRSTIVIPLLLDDKPIGILDVSSAGLFTQNELKRIENISRQLTAAIQRQQANEQVRRSEAFLQSIQNALSASIAILDESGVVVEVNSAWRKFGEQNGLRHPQFCIGMNYLDICDTASGPDMEDARRVARAIRNVIAGYDREVEVEYPCHSPEEKRWFNLRVTRFDDRDHIWVVLAHENITERKKAEEAVRASESIYRKAIEVAGAVPYYETYYNNGRSIKYDFIGEGIRQITGYGPEEFNASLWDTLVEEVELIDDLSGYSIAEGIEQVRFGDIPVWKCEHRLRARDGSMHWVLEAAVELRDEHGMPYGSIGTYQDITSRKLSEQALRENEKRYRALFEDVPIAIWEEDFSKVKAHIDSLKEQGITDLRSHFSNHPEAAAQCAQMIRILDLNNTAVQMFEADGKRQLIQIAQQESSPGEQEHNIEDFIAMAEGRKTNSWEGLDTTCRGKPLEIRLTWSVVPGYENDYSRVIVTTVDLTDRKHVEDELKRSHSLLNTTLESTGDGILVVSMDGTVANYNRKFLELWRIPDNLAMRKADSWLLKYVLDQVKDPDQFLSRVEMLYQMPEVSAIDEVIFLDGRVFERYSQPQRLGDAVVGRVWSFRDISERKRAETAEHEQRILAQALRETAEILNSTLEYGEVLDHILSAVGRVVPHDAGTIMLIEGEIAQVVRSDGYAKRGLNAEITGVKLPLEGTDNLRQILETRQPVIVYDTHSYPGWKRLPVTDWLHSNVGAPISIQGEVIGFILLDSEAVGFFTEVHAERLKAFADQAAVAIQNARLLKQAQNEIAERKQAEQALKESSEQFRTLFQASPEAIMLIDPQNEWRILDCNTTGCVMNGYTHDELVGQSVDLLNLTPGTPIGRAEYLEQVRKEGVLRYETFHQRKDGSVFPLEVSTSLITLGGREIILGIDRDITERKRAEQEIRTSEERFRQLASNIQEVFWITDVATEVDIYLSPAYQSIWGRPPEEQYQDSNVFLESILPEDRTFAQRTMEIQRKGKSTEMEYRIRRPDGSVRWIWDRAFPIFDEGGRVIRLTGIAADITERKQAENFLRERDMLLEEAQKVARLGHYRLNIQTGIWEGSETLNEIFGVDKKYTTDMNGWSAIIHPEQREEILAYFMGHVIEGRNPFDREYRIVRINDGQERWVHGMGRLEYDNTGNPIRMIGTIQDITERKQAEEQLRKLSRAVEQSPSTIVITDIQGNIEYANPKFTETTGYTLEEALGSNPRILKSDHTTSEEYSLLWKTILSGDEWRGEFLNKRKNGELYWESATITPIINEYGKMTHFLAVKEDITQRKKSEAEAQRHVAELEALYENGLAVGRLLNPHEIGERIITTFARHLSWHHVAIRLIQPGTDVLELIAFNQAGMSEEERIDIANRFQSMIGRLGQGLSGWVAQTGKPLRTGNVNVHPQYLNTYSGILSGLYMPLKVGEQIIGVISVESEEPDAFTPQDERLLATLASQAAVAFENARLYHSIEHERERFLDLFENSPIATWLEDFSAVITWMSGLKAQGITDLKSHLQNNPSAFKYGVDLIRILDVNHAAVIMNGTQNKEELIANVHGLLMEDTPSSVMIDELELIWRGYTSFGFEMSSKKLDGSPITGIQRIYIPVANNVPDYTRVIITSTDITDRVEFEKRLSTSEVHYRELADSITDVFFELDQDLHYSHWNKASEILTGFSAEYAIGKSMHDVFGHSDEQIRIGKIYKEVLDTHQARTFETDFIINNLALTFEINAYPSTRGVAVVAKDVTERRRSESLMQKRFELMEYSTEHGLEELMQRALDEISDWTHSAIGFFQFIKEDQVTPSLQVWSTDTFRHFHTSNVEEMHKPADQAGVWAEAIHQRRAVLHNDYGSMPGKKGLPEGHAPLVRELVLPIIRNEKIVAVIGVGNKVQEYTRDDLEITERFADYAWDIIERKQMVIEIAEERNLLANRVEERTSDLSRANSNLARALRVKDEFLANMSHELRTPLNAILGLSESLSEQTAGPLNEKQQRYLTTISESGHHLLSLINDILDLAKIEAGQITLDVHKVDVNSVSQASLRMIKQLAQKKNQEVVLEIDPSVGLMWADERRLKQMVVNLLSNAVKFTPEGGKIGLKIQGDLTENKVTITVWDTGIGIKQSDFERLFQPFVQLDSGLARESSGTGLGLALVSQMARLHGGSVSVHSDPGVGSRFTIILPWEPALPADPVERMKVTGKFRAILPGTTQQTILLIEDTSEVVMMIKDYLEVAGFKVVTAQDGVDGIAQAKLTHPDLILMDVQMPRMDGIEATKTLRQDPEFKYIPIIALTALAMPNDRERCMAAGMDEYLTKPINLRGLTKLLESYLSRREEKTRPR